MVLVVEITEDCSDYGTCPESKEPANTDTQDVNEQQTNNVSVDFLPNILDDYDSYAYHFRLFMADEETIKSRNLLPSSSARRIVIAESAATTIEIDNVNITSFPGPGKQQGFGTSTNFNFTLRQPQGANLLDLIFAGANRLGIKNFSKVPMFLELSFRARNPDRSFNNTTPGFEQEALLGEDNLKDIVWVWPIFLSTMEMKIDSGGSIYDIGATLYEQTAFTNQAADLEKKTTVAANSVTEFFTGLEKELARKENDKVEKSKTQRFEDTYTFYIDKEIAQSKIVPDLAENIANRSAEFNVEGTDKMEYSFDPGTSIDKIVETILTTTEYLQTRTKGTRDKDANAEQSNKESAIVQTVYKLITDTQLGEFDPIRKDYARNYRYLIVPYEMTTLQTFSNEFANVRDQQRYDVVKNKGRLRKAYNYIYTGLNDQVLDFDIVFNFNWHAAVPFQAGVGTGVSQAEPAAAEAKQDADGNKNEAKNETTGQGGLLSKFGINEDGPLGEFVDDITDFIQNEDTIGGAIEGISSGNFDQLTGQTSEFLASQVASGVRVAGSKISPYQTQNQFREIPPIVEDETLDGPDAIKSSVSYIESTQGKDHRISGGYGDSTGKTLLSTMFEQAKSPLSADLLDITLQIKGDPYWLEPAAVARNERFRTNFDVALERYGTIVNPTDPDGNVQQIQPSGNSEVTSMNATGNQTYFLFRSFTPQEPDQDTGLTPGFDDNNVLNGIYAIRKIESTFSGGQFTQAIEGIRDPKISLKGVDIGVGVADTRGLLEQFNIENIIDSVPQVFDDIIPRQSGDDVTGTSGGAIIPDGDIGDLGGIGSTDPNNIRLG